MFAASSFAIWLVLMGSIVAIFGSLIFGGSGETGVKYGYTGPRSDVLSDNLWPKFVKGIWVILSFCFCMFICFLSLFFLKIY